MGTTDDILTKAWELLRSGNKDAAEQLFIVATEAEPGAADAWNGLGAVYFEAGDLSTSLGYYMKARDLELAGRGGSWPERLDWAGDDRPALRSLHGIAMNLFRMGRGEEAEKAFRELLELDPDDHQGARYMLGDMEKGTAPWTDDSSSDE